nr:TIR domain-containing protein [Anaerolineae bacterium]
MTHHSYARKDGFAPSQTLRQRLDSEGFEVWQDLIAMNIGENWHPQIFKAIEQADAVVMVLTPEAIKSPMVRQEWVHARRVGTPIFPVAFTDLYKTVDVPRWVSKVDAVILSPDIVGVEDKWRALLKQLRDPQRRRRVPNMVERLPNEYVERRGLHRLALSGLLDDAQTDPRHTEHASHCVTVLGEGGFGKTTLTQALGLDIAVTEAFTGGVLFVTIGESASQLHDKWNGLLKALTGNPDTASDPLDQLRLKLQGDDFLIILDDVWDKTHIAPILNLPRCTYLISTRDDAVAALASGQPVRVAEMTPEEARDVLLNYLPADKRAQLTDAQREQLKAFGGQLGEWPLLLDIHGYTMREECQRGISVAEALAYVQEGLREEGLDPFPRGTSEDTQRRTLAGSMNASLRHYADDEKQRLYELAIFPDDTAIPQATVLQMWQATAHMSAFKAKKLLRRIAGHFCRFRVEEEGTEPVVRFHDKIREYLGKQLPDPASLHRQLTTGWGDLHALPDAYAWRNLAYHLIEGKQADRLYALLTDYRWLQAKLDATDTNALEADCAAYLAAVTDGETAQTVKLVQSALTMGSHAINYDKTQLPYQLTGRLWTHRDKAGIAELWRTCHTVTPLELIETQTHPPMQQAGGALIRTLTGHIAGVEGALQLKDGRVLSWSRDNTLRLWSPDGHPLATLTGHTEFVKVALQLADGRLLSWSGDKTLRLWSHDGHPIETLTGHSGWVTGARQLADGRVLSWSVDNTLKLWSPDGHPLATLIGHTYLITGALQLADGRLLSWSWDTTLRLWSPDAQTNDEDNAHAGIVMGILRLSDGRVLSWSEDKTLKLWSADGRPLATLTGHTG